MAEGNSIKRKAPLQRRTQLQRSKKKINPRSKKKIRTDREYAKGRDKFMQQEDNQLCVLKFPGCTIYAQAPHHPEGRGVEHLNDVASFLPACNWCNQYADDHPAEALAKGVSKRKHTISGKHEVK